MFSHDFSGSLKPGRYNWYQSQRSLGAKGISDLRNESWGMVECDKKKNVECVCCDVAGFGPLGLYSVLGVRSYQFSYLIPFRYVYMFRNMNTGRTPMDSHTPSESREVPMFDPETV